MADFQNIWAILTGLFGILMAVPLIVCYVHSQLPTRQLQPMFDLLGDADALLLSCAEEGLVYGRKAQNYETKLTQCVPSSDVLVDSPTKLPFRLRTLAEEARLRATAAKSYYEELANWWEGLTRGINDICKNIREVRADISCNSLRERERREAQRRATTVGPANGEQAGGNLSAEVSTEDVTASPQDSVYTGDTSVFTDDRAAPLPCTEAPSSIIAAHRDISSSSLCSSSVSSSETLVTAPITPSITTAPTIPSPNQLTHDRRCSVSSVSSNTSSMESEGMRLKRGADPLSRAHTMARFVRQVCGTRSPPVFHVGLHRLATFKFVEPESDDDGDDEWVEEGAIRVITVV